MMFIRARTHAARNSSMRGPMLPSRTRSRGASGTCENLRIVSTGPRSERGGMIAWTLLPSGSRASAHGDDSSTRRPKGPTMRSIRWTTASSPSNRPSPALSIRPFRSTYTSSGPFTMTSVTSGSFSRNSMGPNPTTSSETSFTTRARSRWGRMWPCGSQDRERLLAHAHTALGARRAARPRASTRCSSRSRRSRRTCASASAGIPAPPPRALRTTPTILLPGGSHTTAATPETSHQWGGARERRSGP